MHRKHVRSLISLLVALSAAQIAYGGQQSVHVPITTVFPFQTASLDSTGTVAVLPDTGSAPAIRFSFMPPRNFKDGSRFFLTVYYLASTPSACNFLLHTDYFLHWQPGQDLGTPVLRLDPVDGSDEAPAQTSSLIVQTESYEFPVSVGAEMIRRGDIVNASILRDRSDPLDTCDAIDMNIAGLRVDYTSR